MPQFQVLDIRADAEQLEENMTQALTHAEGDCTGLNNRRWVETTITGVNLRGQGDWLILFAPIPGRWTQFVVYNNKGQRRAWSPELHRYDTIFIAFSIQDAAAFRWFYQF